MNINDVITLDNDAKYLILDIIEYEKKYAYCVGIYDDGNIDYEDFLFFTIIDENDETYLEKVTDNDLIKKLTLFIVSDSITNTEEENEQIASALENAIKEDDK